MAVSNHDTEPSAMNCTWACCTDPHVLVSVQAKAKLLSDRKKLAEEVREHKDGRAKAEQRVGKLTRAAETNAAAKGRADAAFSRAMDELRWVWLLCCYKGQYSNESLCKQKISLFKWPSCCSWGAIIFTTITAVCFSACTADAPRR